jgi:RAD51-like protein 2
MSGKPLLMEQVDRVAEMATAVSTHLSKISRSRKMDHKARELGVDFVAIAAAMTMNRFLEGINVYRVHDQIELLALIDQLPGILSLNSKIRIIIIDSIAFHFRQSLQDTAHRSRLLSSVSQQLNQLAHEFHVAVAVTNHMTTKIDSGATTTMDLSNFGSGSSAVSTVIPALGDVWSHCITNRILLSWKGEQRIVTIVKSPAWASASAPFIISTFGVRDVPQVCKSYSRNLKVCCNRLLMSYQPITPESGDTSGKKRKAPEAET